MPWKSEAQRRWGNSPAGHAALGDAGVKEWNSATRGRHLPSRLLAGGAIQSALNTARRYGKKYADGGDVDDVEDVPGVGPVPSTLNSITRPVANVATAMGKGLADWVATPRNMMNDSTPQMPESGTWSDEQEAQRQINQEAKANKEIEFGGQTALSMYGANAPFVEPGALGVAAGRMTSADRTRAGQLAQQIADHLVTTHSETPNMPAVVAHDIYQIANRHGPQTADAIFDALPEGMHGKVDEALDGWANEYGLNPWTQGRDPATIKPPQPGEAIQNLQPEDISRLRTVADRITSAYPEGVPPQTPNNVTLRQAVQMTPEQINNLPRETLRQLDTQITSKQGTEAFDELEELANKYPKGWNTLNERLNVKAGESLYIPKPGDLGLELGNTHTPHPASDWMQTRRANFEHNFNEQILPHVGTPDEFFNKYFGGLHSANNIESEWSNAGGFNFAGALMDKAGNTVGRIERSFDPQTKTAYHGYLKVNPDFRGSGVVPNMLRNQIDFYRKLGIDRVMMNANIDVGGYAWAKYGWAPKTTDGWQYLANTMKSMINRNDVIIQSPQAKSDLLQILSNRDPSAIWHLADYPAKDAISGKPIGKALLSGRSWAGVLHLNRPEALNRFYSYVGKKKPANAE